MNEAMNTQPEVQGKTKTDVVYNKRVVMNGQKLKGVYAIDLSFDMDETITILKLKMAVKRDSVKISEPDETGKQTISFETIQ